MYVHEIGGGTDVHSGGKDRSGRWNLWTFRSFYSWHTSVEYHPLPCFYSLNFKSLSRILWFSLVQVTFLGSDTCDQGTGENSHVSGIVCMCVCVHVCVCGGRSYLKVSGIIVRLCTGKRHLPAIRSCLRSLTSICRGEAAFAPEGGIALHCSS